jgi:S1-C subfamily serine protease
VKGFQPKHKLAALLVLLFTLYSVGGVPTVAQRFHPWLPPPFPTVVAPEGTLYEVFERSREATLRIEGRATRFAPRPDGVGTGFFISEDGLVLTAYHVIEWSNLFTAVTADERRLRLEVVGFDASLDLALLRAVTRQSVPFLSLSDFGPEVGEAVVAIGNSRGDFLEPRSGTITRLSVDPASAFFAAGAIELTNALAPGDSGGPVINAEGMVVGVVSYISFRPDLNPSQETSGPLPPGGARDFASYAVPVLQSSPILSDLLEGVQRPVPAVGFRAGNDYDPELFPGEPLGPLAGATVQFVSPGGPGERAGLRAPREEATTNLLGQSRSRVLVDVIVAVDGERTRNANEAIAAIRRKRVGDDITLTVQRNQETVEIELTLVPRASVNRP